MAQKDKSFQLNKKYYVNVGITLLADPELDSNDKVVYMYMKFRYQHFSKKGGRYFESTTTIGDAVGLHRNTITKCLAKLEQLGMLKIERTKGGSNVYIVTERQIPITPQVTKILDFDVESPF